MLYIFYTPKSLRMAFQGLINTLTPELSMACGTKNSTRQFSTNTKPCFTMFVSYAENKGEREGRVYQINL